MSFVYFLLVVCLPVFPASLFVTFAVISLNRDDIAQPLKDAVSTLISPSKLIYRSLSKGPRCWSLVTIEKAKALNSPLI